MSDTKFTVPLALNQTNQCTITPPWFVNESEYHPLPCSFEPLVNGEEAFGAVYEAIAAAKKSVCIICWGFQPSMYFVRSGAGAALPIGALLEKIAMQGVKVRVLCFAIDPLWGGINVMGRGGESNVPGRHVLSAGKDYPFTSSIEQYRFDQQWYLRYDVAQTGADKVYKTTKLGMESGRKTYDLLFVSRGFSPLGRGKIATQDYDDKGLSSTSKSVLSSVPTHHQKMVLVDYEDPKLAVGFVMGHNMLDEYWDKSAHSCKQYPAALGRNGNKPRQDFSSRVRGPILGDLFNNFAQAWEDERTVLGFHVETLPKVDFSKYPVGNTADCKAMAQLLRTQPQYGVQDIKRAYLQAVNNATQYIYIENQYFRWPPLADKIKAAAKAQTGAGRSPNKHGSLYLFVITNASDEGVGPGTVNTYRMLDSLGRADTIPAVARQERAIDLEAQTGRARHDAHLQRERFNALQSVNRQSASGQSEKRKQQLAEEKAKLDAAEARQKALEGDLSKAQEKDAAVLPEARPGLKIHVCTLVAPDTPDNTDWMDVYIHAKLMLIDDAFMTLGSANINTRSMQVDSELNIILDRPEIAHPLRKRLWGLHTNGIGAQEDPDAAFKAWTDVIQRNKVAKQIKQKPIASLVEFYRDDPTRSNQD